MVNANDDERRSPLHWPLHPQSINNTESPSPTCTHLYPRLPNQMPCKFRQVIKEFESHLSCRHPKTAKSFEPTTFRAVNAESNTRHTGSQNGVGGTVSTRACRPV